MKYLLIILLLTLLALVNSSRYRCHEGVLIYDYHSKMQYSDKDKKKPTTSEYKAKVELTCAKKKQVGGNEILFMVMKVLRIEQHQDGKRIGQAESAKLATFTAFALTSTGEVGHVWYGKEDSQRIVTLKKTIISLFQTKLTGQTREEKTQQGVVVTNYRQRVTKEGKLLVRAHRTQENILKPGDPNQKARSSEMSYTSYLILEHTGVPSIIFTKEKNVPGKGDERKAKMYAKKKNQVEQSKKLHPNNLNPDILGMTSTTKLTLTQIVQTKKDHHKNDKRVLSLMNSENDEELHLQGFRKADLLLEPATITFTQEVLKQDLDKNIDLEKILDVLQENTENMDLLAKAQMYSRHVSEKAIPILSKRYNSLSAQLNEKELDFGKQLQSIITAAQTPEAQVLLLKTMQHPSMSLLSHGISQTLSLENPTLSVVKVLRTLSKTNQIKGLAEDDVEDINNHAYLAYARSASVLDTVHSSEIVNDIVNELAKSQNAKELELHLYALSNAGASVPLEIHSNILNSGIHTAAKVISMNALENRGEDEEEKVTQLIHSLLSSDIEDEIKIHAIKVQTKRENTLQSRSSVLEFKQYLDNPILSKEVEEYYDEAGIDPQTLSNRENVLGFGSFFRRIGNAVRRAVRTVGNAVSSAIDKLKEAANKAGSAISDFANRYKAKFSAATFTGQKSCVKANRANEQLCVYDTDMAAYIREQGDLSIMKWSKFFVFEKLIGAQILHLYIGSVGYGGMQIDCTESRVDAAFFVRGEVSARFLDNRLNVITVSGELQKRGEEELKDRGYVKIGPAVVVNKPFVPEKLRGIINYCKKHIKPLYAKSWPQLAKYEYTFVIVAVPVRLAIVVSASLGVDLTGIVCPFRLTLTVGVEPWFKLGVAGQVGVSVLIGSAGLKVNAEFNYRLLPSLGTANCNLCVVLDHRVDPLKITFGLYVSALGKTWDKDLYSWSAPTINGNLFKFCIKNGPYTPFQPSEVVRHPMGVLENNDYGLLSEEIKSSDYQTISLENGNVLEGNNLLERELLNSQEENFNSLNVPEQELDVDELVQKYSNALEDN